ncbi:DUF4350 domain-containing protein [Roseateles sp. DC23W]|uniref:DUF4350 domain-containing protein n=1 Tax=Pelomonas dachongensis TaxID=3299029 RepID=A0ABW7EM21_9BURK
MTVRRLAWLLAAAALLLLGWWLTTETEWVDDERARPARGEARDNPVYAFEQLLRRLGMTVAHHEALATLPPPGARLLLLSHDWELVPGRAAQLRQWVEQGGHLVLTQPSDWDDTALKTWVPVSEVYVSKSERQPRPVPEGPSAPRARRPASQGPTELQSTPPLWDGTAWVAACHGFEREWFLRAQRGQAPVWTLAQVDGTRKTQALLAQQAEALDAVRPASSRSAPSEPAAQAMRLPIGQGSVTVLNVNARIFHNAGALDCEHPLLLAAAVQAEPGAVAWIYLQEKREALLPWLWHGGWIAIVALLLALAAALWRAAVRFGPRLAPAPRLRRSISEQVRGLGAYLHGTGREALLAAQQRALVEQATRSLPRFARLPSAERARAIADATGLPALDLAAALTARFSTRAELAQRLQVLETARRRLLRHLQERPTP